jgi:hypothetical protein
VRGCVLCRACECYLPVRPSVRPSARHWFVVALTVALTSPPRVCFSATLGEAVDEGTRQCVDALTRPWLVSRWKYAETSSAQSTSLPLPKMHEHRFLVRVSSQRAPSISCSHAVLMCSFCRPKCTVFLASYPVVVSIPFHPVFGAISVSFPSSRSLLNSRAIKTR